MARTSTPGFCWKDPLLLETQLNDDERLLRDAARDYCQGRLLPRVQKSLRHELTDREIYPEMGEVGPLGPTIPTEYGGAGRNYVSYGLVAREVERVDSGYRSMMISHQRVLAVLDAEMIRRGKQACRAPATQSCNLAILRPGSHCARSSRSSACSTESASRFMSSSRRRLGSKRPVGLQPVHSRSADSASGASNKP